MDLQQSNVKRLQTLEEAGIEPGHLGENSLIATLLDGSRWIYKFGTGEEEDEVFAYRLAKEFFGGVVPLTVAADFGKGLGSAQRLVQGESAHAWAEADLSAFFHKMRSPVLMQDLANIVVLDYLVGNTDRHGHNWLIMPNGHLAAIDNGMAGNDLNIAFAHALEPAGRAMLVDDCAHSPMFVSLIESVLKRVKGRAPEVAALGAEVSFKEMPHICVSCEWNNKVEKALVTVSSWRRNLAEMCGYVK